MFIQQIYTQCLSQASYYIESDGIAAIIDPIRDVDNYLKLAAQRKAQISYVFLTHFHADFVSGHMELAAAAGALIVLGPHASPHYPAVIARNRESFTLGRCRVEVLHTPGHTLESSCFLLYDEKDKPSALFSGDTLFIGDVGRPDLLSGNLDARELAYMLYDSIRDKIKSLPDDVIVYPGHGAGSACGKNLGKETISTIGEQKRTNYALQLERNDFIDAVTAGQPFAPPYFFKDAAINMNGYESLDSVLKQSVQGLTAERFRKEIAGGALVLDTRDAAGFGKGFIKGAVNIGLDGQFALWAGTLLPFDVPLLLVTAPGSEREAIIRLARIGYDRVTGYLANGMDAWKAAGGETDQVETVSISTWQFIHPGYTLLDVRRPGEFQQGHLRKALHIPLEQLESRLQELGREQRYAVYCAGGYRSMIAVSILRRNGFEHLLNIEGGIAAVKIVYPGLIKAS